MNYDAWMALLEMRKQASTVMINGLSLEEICVEIKGKHSRKYVRHIKFDCNLHQCDAGCSLFMGM